VRVRAGKGRRLLDISTGWKVLYEYGLERVRVRAGKCLTVRVRAGKGSSTGWKVHKCEYGLERVRLAGEKGAGLFWSWLSMYLSDRVY
jgi:hypothetical protein